MYFYFCAKYFFIYIAILFFCLLLIPYSVISKFLLYLSIILFLSNMLLTPLVFKWDRLNIKFLEKIKYVFQNIKLYDCNQDYWVINYFHTLALCFLLFIVSFLKNEIYESITAGICTGAIITSIMYYYNFLYEKFKFHRELYNTLVKDISLIDITSKNLCELNTNIDIDSSDFILTTLDKLDINENFLYQELKNTKVIISSYGDISYHSLKLINSIDNSIILNCKLKNLFIKIVSKAKDDKLLIFFQTLTTICNDLENYIIELMGIMLETRKLYICITKNTVGSKNLSEIEINQRINDVKNKIVNLNNRFITHRLFIYNMLETYKKITHLSR